MTTEPAREVGSESPIEHAFAAALSPRRERTRERLLDAAFTVFAHHGIHGASIEAVCEAAGFSRGAFYSNFSSKEELFLALAERAMRQQLAMLESIGEELQPDAVRGGTVNHEAISSVLSVMTTDPDDARQWTLMHAELELLAMRDPAVGQPFLAQKEMLRTELGAAIARILDSLGLQFAVDERTAIDLLVSVHESASRAAVVASPAHEHGGAMPDSTALGTLVNFVVTTAD